MEPFNKDAWLRSVMNTKKLTHLHRVIAWHLLQMADEDWSIPCSMMEMGRRIGFTVDRSHIYKCMTSLTYAGYVMDFGAKPSGTRDTSGRFRLIMPMEMNDRAVVKQEEARS